jgi:hypothetical protein
MAVPGEGHEDVGNGEENDGFHLLPNSYMYSRYAPKWKIKVKDD